MSSKVILQRPLNTVQDVNAIYKRAQSISHRPVPLYDLMAQGIRVAKSDGRARATLSAVLERCVELFDKEHEAQRGQTRRSAQEGHAERFETPELNMFKEAYRALADGLPLAQYGALYAAAAWYEGIIDGPCGWGWWEG